MAFLFTDERLGVLARNDYGDCRVSTLNSQQGFLSGKKNRDTIVQLLPGLELLCMKLESSHDVAVCFRRDQAFLEFGCLLSGRVWGYSNHCGEEKRHFGGGPGQTWFSYCHKAHGTMEYRTGQPVCVVLFIVSAPLLDTFLPINQSGIVPEPECNEKLISFNGTGSFTPEVSRIVHQILQKNHQLDELSRLYLISKAYELLFHLVAEKNKEENGILPSVNPVSIHRASQILLENLEATPKLADIAKQSGLCLTSLNAGFRKLFGTTVFGFLRQERLSKAKYLMEHENKSASEAAWEVGYSSLSSFHRAFYAQYGVTPGYYSRKQQKQVHQ